MTILAIETATAYKDHPASIALAHESKVHFVELTKPNSLAAQLICSIESLLSEHQLWYSDLAQLAITVGPGSFTGIRIGLTVARTLAFACPKLQLSPITTLEGLAASYASTCPVQIIQRAGKGELYCQVFESGKATSDIQILAPEALQSDLSELWQRHRRPQPNPQRARCFNRA